MPITDWYTFRCRKNMSHSGKDVLRAKINTLSKLVESVRYTESTSGRPVLVKLTAFTRNMLSQQMLQQGGGS